MDKTIGFIGCGNMASAMIGGIRSAGLVSGEAVTASDRGQEKLAEAAGKYGICITADNKEAAAKSDLLVLAVKPGIYQNVIAEIRDCISEQTVIISIAAGQTIASVEAMFGRPIRLIRAMPNTPALVGEAMSALSGNQYVSQENMEDAISIFESFGKCAVVAENLMETVTGVSGSSPAYVYLFIEAMADAAVVGGMPREQAYKFAAQSVLGAARMVLETGMHPGELKDQVCSPGGTTIAAVAKLEEKGLRGTVMSGIEACIQKARDMQK